MFSISKYNEIIVFKYRDNDHKNDNMKIVRGVKGKKTASR
ncbi:hypothetical protein ECP029943810_2401 [Escherichia coli P0299438.10]|nr:hypothetical protein EC2016001_2934 [Escherichia coli 201600.1]ENB87810.1 hypothetical protein ECP029943810_2401 [Escherichia coli P0299438.10]ENC04096.1 hypothetical protein ECP02994384_2495 [Escherichia coli P0299438.4]KDT01266.1 hypothetical protein AB54_2247 [Escherichia coli 2-011-08_S1_C3]